ncbi:hypothetical protein [Actinocrispum sp. NPDC049592]|uniref:hypothetical protein n=1 Tax=Actinocrispum sp. NPDC049592 TaxID=3154835 RepID=UPI003430B9FB
MRTGVFLRWVAHPLTVGATAVLLLNDHVLKQAWPGLVTGKLSDVAGLVVAPPALGLLFGLFLTGRIGAAAAVLVTGAGFTVVKLTSAGAQFASEAWSVVNGPSAILADPTDLVALPALGLTWWTWRRASAAAPLPDSVVSRFRVIIGVPFAVLAIAATSAAQGPSSVDSVKSTDALVVISVGGRDYSSPSGLGNWTPAPWSPMSPPEPPQRKIEACVPDDAAHCYRVHGGGDLYASEKEPRGGRLLGVDETTDARRTWHTAWEVPAARWSFIVRQHRVPSAETYPSEVASVDIVVRTVPGGHEVFVANGVEGLAVRDVNGTWRRVPVVDTAAGLDIRPVPLTQFGRAVSDEFIAAGLLTLLALLLGLTVAAGRARAQRGRAGSVMWLPLGVLFVIVVSIPILVAASFITPGSASTQLALVFALCVVAVAIAVTLPQQALRRSRTSVVIAAAVLTGLAYIGPVLGWTMGHPQDRSPALQLGALLAAVSLVLVIAAGWWAGRSPTPQQQPVDSTDGNPRALE